MQLKICSRFPIYWVNISTGNEPLIERSLLMNIPPYLLVTLAAETHLKEGQLRRLMPTLNKLNFRAFDSAQEGRQFPKGCRYLLPFNSADKDRHHTYCCSYRECEPKPNFIWNRHTTMEVHLEANSLLIRCSRNVGQHGACSTQSTVHLSLVQAALWQLRGYIASNGVDAVNANCLERKN